MRILSFLLCMCLILTSCSESSKVEHSDNEYNKNGYWVHPEKHASPADRAIEEARVKAVRRCQLRSNTKEESERCDAHNLEIKN